MFRYERRTEPLASAAIFFARLFGHFLVALLIIAAMLFAGMFGYRALAGLSWVDAFLNAAMILGGMGPVNELHTDAAKLFAGFYALACGLIFVVASGILLAPALHRLLHSLHVADDDDAK